MIDHFSDGEKERAMRSERPRLAQQCGVVIDHFSDGRKESYAEREA